MMTQNVTTQMNLFGMASGNQNVKNKQPKTSFDLLIGYNPKNGKEVMDNPGKGSQILNNDKKTDMDSSSKSSNQNVFKKSVGTDPVKKSDQSIDLSENDKSVKSVELDVTDDQQILAQINAMLQSIREVIMNQLNLTSGQLDDLLSSQGLSNADLLSPETLQQLVLANSQITDLCAFLTNENLADTMNQLMQTVDQTKVDADFNLTDEQMKSILHDVTSDLAKGSPHEEEAFAESSVLELGDAGKSSKQKESANTSGNKSEEQISEAGKIQIEVNKLDSSGKSNSQHQTGLKKDNNTDANSPNQLQSFMDHLVKSQEIQTNFNGEMTQVTELRDIVNQIVNRIRVMIKPDQTSMELQLNPEHLGRVNLTLLSKDGVVTARFGVQNELSKEAIEGQLQTLKDTLNQQGVKVEAIEVAISNFAFAQNSQEESKDQRSNSKGSTGKKISLEDAMSMKELPEEGSDHADSDGVTGSQIDYTA